MSVFLGEYLHILHIHNTILHVFLVLEQCLLLMEKCLQFTCIFSKFAVHGRHGTSRDGRKCAKNFGVLGVSGLNK